jgi:pantetheine-phosphate adenylyltransferase
MRALFAATFDPATNGHLDLISRSSACHVEVVAGVYEQPESRTLFSTEERVALLREATAHLPNVSVRDYRGLTVDFAREIGASVLVRGLRAVSDFEYEFALSAMNRRLAPELDTVFFLSAPEHAYVSSSLVREIGALGRGVGPFVPSNVATAVAAKYGDTSPRR